MHDGYISIGFVGGAAETAETVVQRLEGFVVRIATADGESNDYVLIGPELWDDHVGMPVSVRRCNEDHDPIGEPFAVDAVRILIY